MKDEPILTKSYSDLLAENSAQRTRIASLEAEVAELTAKVQWLMEQLNLAKHRQFGASSEKSEYDFAQMSLFNEAEFFADPKLEEPKLTAVKEHYRKTRLTTDKLPEDLPVEVVEHEIPETERVCPDCGGHMHDIGTETVREELKLVPASASIVRHVRHSYSCRHCEAIAADDPVPMLKATVPDALIKGSFATAEAVAHIMTQKLAMGVPLYRQEQEWKRNGILLSRQTMSNWLLRCSEDYLENEYAKLKMELLAREVLHCDETELQVLKEPGRSAQSKSYLWVYRTGSDAEHPIVLAEYQPTRRGKCAAEFLSGFSGYLHTDGYEGYHNLPPNITVVGCFAHSRRKWDEALKALPEKDREGTLALIGKRYCDRLFELEREFSGLPPDERFRKRLEKSKPVLDEFRAWMESLTSLGKNLLGRAVRYTLDQWRYLERYLLDGRLEISNNRAERTIRPYAIDRKNFLFANTPRGAKASAVVFSIVQTAIERGLNPYDVLVGILRHGDSYRWA
jgi:transposase